MDVQDIMNLQDDQCTDTLVAEMVMSELKPDYEPENYLELNIDSNVIPPLSSKKCWICYCYYEHGDVPEWEPQPFSADIRQAYIMEEHLRERGLAQPYADCLVKILELGRAKDATRFDLAHATPLQRCQAAIWLMSEI
jgi:hypothetical protein